MVQLPHSMSSTASKGQTSTDQASKKVMVDVQLPLSSTLSATTRPLSGRMTWMVGVCHGDGQPFCGIHTGTWKMDHIGTAGHPMNVNDVSDGGHAATVSHEYRNCVYAASSEVTDTLGWAAAWMNTLRGKASSHGSPLYTGTPRGRLLFICCGKPTYTLTRARPLALAMTWSKDAPGTGGRLMSLTRRVGITGLQPLYASVTPALLAQYVSNG